GYIAQELAINYPGRVDKLVLASTAAATSERNKRLFHNMFEQRERGMDFETSCSGFSLPNGSTTRSSSERFFTMLWTIHIRSPWPG
ncbi:MAG: alpha/beta hydrolase, partial [bacterium]|nr:alpha/beta hydrolase [bacterium]